MRKHLVFISLCLCILITYLLLKMHFYLAFGFIFFMRNYNFTLQNVLKCTLIPEQDTIQDSLQGSLNLICLNVLTINCFFYNVT